MQDEVHGFTNKDSVKAAPLQMERVDETACAEKWNATCPLDRRRHIENMQWLKKSVFLA